MKETKFYPLLVLSVLFLIISFIMLCILGYNFYTQSQTRQTAKVQVAKKEKNAAIEKTRDTLQQIYAAAVNTIPSDAGIDSVFKKADSNQLSMMNNQLGDVYKLKTEINSLLKDSSSSSADLELARYKIRELQLKVDDLKNRNTDIEKENRRLRILLEQFVISNSSGSNQAVRNPEAIERLNDNTSSSSSIFSASEIKFTPANEEDTEVNSAEEAEKFVGTMMVRNSLLQGTGELMLVLIQPDGKVLRNAWESGSFDTDNGKKIYSRKLRFDYNKGELRRINFSVPATTIQKGTYTLQVYNNGKVIGKAAKVVG